MEWTNLQATLRRVADDARAYYQERLKDKKVNTTEATLSNTAQSEVMVETDGVAAVLHLQEYWKYVEYGRRPGKWPPVNAIRRWVEIKPVMPRADGRGRIPTVNSLAYLISRKIATEGIEPRPLLQETIDEMQKKWIEEITAAVIADMDNFVSLQ